MSEIFKTRVEPAETQEILPQPHSEFKSDKLEGYEDKAVDAPTEEENNLEIWEGLNRRKYGHDYFDIRDIADTFPVKAEFGFIDKFVKAEMAERGIEMNIQNYADYIQKIEEEIGTSNLETYKRINRIFQYIKTLQKYRDIKKKKDSYLSTQIPD